MSEFHFTYVGVTYVENCLCMLILITRLRYGCFSQIYFSSSVVMCSYSHLRQTALPETMHFASCNASAALMPFYVCVMLRQCCTYALLSLRRQCCTYALLCLRHVTPALHLCPSVFATPVLHLCPSMFASCYASAALMPFYVCVMLRQCCTYALLCYN
jgi:hypothetical protein